MEKSLILEEFNGKITHNLLYLKYAAVCPYFLNARRCCIAQCVHYDTRALLFFLSNK